jgi:hypothetical protein
MGENTGIRANTREGEGGGTSELVRLAARLIIEEALEGEARHAVGRDYYARGPARRPAPVIATAIERGG